MYYNVTFPSYIFINPFSFLLFCSFLALPCPLDRKPVIYLPSRFKEGSCKVALSLSNDTKALFISFLLSKLCAEFSLLPNPISNLTKKV